MTARTIDPRRSFMVNGNAYRREMARKEPDVTLTQSFIAGIVIAVWTIGILALAAGVS